MQDMQNTKLEQLASNIDQYLQAGGLFNPELMDHLAVRDLLIEMRDEIRKQ